MRLYACLSIAFGTLASGCASDQTAIAPPLVSGVAQEVVEMPAATIEGTPDEATNDKQAPSRAADWRSSPLQNEAAFCSTLLEKVSATLSEADRRAEAMRFGLMAQNVKAYLLEITGDRAMSRNQIEAMLRPISPGFNPTREDIELCTELGEAVAAEDRGRG